MSMHTPHLGVCYYPEHWPEDQWTDDARRMVSVGIRQVRLAEFSWSKTEPERGQFAWAWLDKAVDVLAEAGLSLTLCTPTATRVVLILTVPLFGSSYRDFDRYRFTIDLGQHFH